MERSFSINIPGSAAPRGAAAAWEKPAYGRWSFAIFIWCVFADVLLIQLFVDGGEARHREGGIALGKAARVHARGGMGWGLCPHPPLVSTACPPQARSALPPSSGPWLCSSCPASPWRCVSAWMRVLWGSGQPRSWNACVWMRSRLSAPSQPPPLTPVPHPSTHPTPAAHNQPQQMGAQHLQVLDGSRQAIFLSLETLQSKRAAQATDSIPARGELHGTAAAPDAPLPLPKAH